MLLANDSEDEILRLVRESETPKGPPPLRSFGLVLHHDGAWTHEGRRFHNQRLREKFDRSVRYLPNDAVYVVQIGRFRGLIEVQEAGFFVREFDPESGEVRISDDSAEPLDIMSLTISGCDGALLCRIKQDLARGGLLARFDHAAHADFMNAIEADGESIVIAGERRRIPAL